MAVTAGHDAKRADGPSALLGSKLRRPAVPNHFVARPRLEQVFDGVTNRPLTLVISPAGSGKTVFLADWVRHAEIRTSWLSLEELDDDPVALRTGLIGALEPLAPDCAPPALAQIAGGAAIGDVVRSLLADLEATSPGDGVLVLDDVHHINDPRAVDSLGLFVQHLPSWLHVVMAARTNPRIPLDRMRVRGQVAELRFAELRFTAAEARDVLANLAPGLSEADIEASVECTDGWAAGVQLAALSAQAGLLLSPTSSPSDIQPLAEDYVWHEVMASGDADVVDALLRISVVDRVNTSLATAITGLSDVHDLLLRGEAQGLFVYRLGDQDWFRIHPLVRQALLSELTRSSRHREHHERAAQWLEAADETVHALDQWLLADRPREALRLLAERSTELYDMGRESVIARTLDAIPRDIAVRDVPALIDLSISHILGPREQFVETVGHTLWYAERTEHDLSPQLDSLQAIALTASGSWTAGRASALRAIAELDVRWWNDPAGRFAWNTAARGVALSEQWDDDDRFVRDATMAMSRDPRRGISLEGVRALGHAFAGRPVDALRVAAGVRPAAATMSILRVELALAEAVARLEMGDRDRAVTDLQAIADDLDEPRLYAPVAAMLALAGVAVDEGDVDAATSNLARARSLVDAARGGVDLQKWVRRTATVVAIACGDIDEARRSAASLSDPFWGPVGRARLRLALDDPVAAASELGVALPRNVRHQVVVDLLRARASTAPDDVLAHTTAAIELACTHRIVQSVVGDGRELIDVIERAAWRVPDESMHRLRLAMAPSGLPRQLPKRAFPEDLTDRERDVLRLLPSRLTFGEIAKELYVSVNTVKFHVRVIYRKLGVNSRQEAAAIARSMSTSR